jgi:hypothetical protein
VCSFTKLKPIGRNVSSGLFGWTFIVFAWNMIARSISVSQIMLEHISMEQDCAVLLIPKDKVNKRGDIKKKCHIFASPETPLQCPFLALACYVFFLPGSGRG